MLHIASAGVWLLWLHLRVPLSNLLALAKALPWFALLLLTRVLLCNVLAPAKAIPWVALTFVRPLFRLTRVLLFRDLALAKALPRFARHLGFMTGCVWMQKERFVRKEQARSGPA